MILTANNNIVIYNLIVYDLACGWDGGDCCGDINDQYCSVCECLDPEYEGGDCGDIWPTQKCEKRKKKGKCNKNWVKKHCQMTCEYC